MWIYFVLFCVCFFLFYLSMLCITNTICNPVGIDGMTCSSLQIFTCTNNTNPFAQPSADWQKDVLLGTIFTCTNHFKFYFILIIVFKGSMRLSEIDWLIDWPIDLYLLTWISWLHLYFLWNIQHKRTEWISGP